jgi:uncharacterized protein (TIGR02186 family)
MRARPAARLGLLACAATLALPSGARARPESMPLAMEPTHVEIGLLYSGVDLTVSTEREPATDLAVLVTGPASDLALREKARRWGLFWAPAGEVHFEGVPSLYLLRTTTPLEELAPARVLEDLGLGYPALRAALGPETRDDLFRELIVLKESEGLFSTTPGGDGDREAPADGGSSYRTTLHIPARARAGTYSVGLFAFRDGQLVTRTSGNVELEKAGFVAYVSTLAESHGLAYGIFAVVIAVAAGLLVGFLFGSTRKKT